MTIPPNSSAYVYVDLSRPHTFTYYISARVNDTIEYTSAMFTIF